MRSVQVEETRRKADEETKKAVEKAVEKTKKEIKEKVVDESVVAEYKIKLDAANQAVKQLTEASADTEKAKEHAEAEVKQLREKLIKREQKLTVVIQEKAEAQSTVKDLEAEVAASRKKQEKSKKELKSCEESLKMTRTEFERECSSRYCWRHCCVLLHLMLARRCNGRTEGIYRKSSISIGRNRISARTISVYNRGLTAGY
jgi:chromosome segregation ATPase